MHRVRSMRDRLPKEKLQHAILGEGFEQQDSGSRYSDKHRRAELSWDDYGQRDGLRIRSNDNDDCRSCHTALHWNKHRPVSGWHLRRQRARVQRSDHGFGHCRKWPDNRHRGRFQQRYPFILREMLERGHGRHHRSAKYRCGCRYGRNLQQRRDHGCGRRCPFRTNSHRIHSKRLN